MKWGALCLMCWLASAGAEKAIEGRWRMEEKGLVVEINRGTDGWSGVVVESRQKVEVGKTVFQGLMFRPGEGNFVGVLRMPEDDSTHAVAVTVADGTMRAVVRKLIFSKTIVLTKIEGTSKAEAPR